VHLKDVDLQLASQVRAGELTYGDAVHRGVFKPLGQGDLDINVVIEQLLPTDYHGWFVLEQDTALAAEPEPNGGPVMAAGQSLAYFHQVSGAAVSG
jgi:inosose dehydratase